MKTEPYLDLDNAKRHRERDRGLTDGYYDQQARAVAQWGLGEARPHNVRVGELPQLTGGVNYDSEKTVYTE